MVCKCQNGRISAVAQTERGGGGGGGGAGKARKDVLLTSSLTRVGTKMSQFGVVIYTRVLSLSVDVNVKRS